MGRFQGKSIIVTGAGSGIGRAAALQFAAEGGSVVCADKTEGADETARLIGEAGGTAVAIRIDAGLEEDVVRAVALAPPAARAHRCQGCDRRRADARRLPGCARRRARRGWPPDHARRRLTASNPALTPLR